MQQIKHEHAADLYLTDLIAMMVNMQIQCRYKLDANALFYLRNVAIKTFVFYYNVKETNDIWLEYQT